MYTPAEQIAITARVFTARTSASSPDERPARAMGGFPNEARASDRHRPVTTASRLATATDHAIKASAKIVEPLIEPEGSAHGSVGRTPKASVASHRGGSVVGDRYER